MSTRIGDWMQTAGGRMYYPADPRAEDVSIQDIAHALSHLCRFGGHCSRFYSVAEHSVLVSMVVPPEYALQGLLHDAAEAYCVDIPRPLKKQLLGYAAIEDRNWQAIVERFGLPFDLHDSVHDADNAVLLAERDALLGPAPARWSVPGEPAQVGIVGFPPTVARGVFLQRFFDLSMRKAAP